MNKSQKTTYTKSQDRTGASQQVAFANQCSNLLAVRATTEKNPSTQFNVNNSTEIKNVRSLENCFYYTLYYCIIKISYYKN